MTELQIPVAPQGQLQPQGEKHLQSVLLVAKKFPRDEIESLAKIKKACGRHGLAQVAVYKFPRGGQSVTGPSIRLAEVIAQHWGNLDCGIREIENKDGQSLMEAWCHDLESNYRKVIQWTVKHSVGTKMGLKTLTDPRDIYEKIANDGSRRLRACMLAVIPVDIVDVAVSECKRTLLKSADDKPLSDRIREMAVAFGEVGVSKQMLEGKLGHSLEEMDLNELTELRSIYMSLRDNMSKREDWFSFEPVDKKLNDLIGV